MLRRELAETDEQGLRNTAKRLDTRCWCEVARQSGGDPKDADRFAKGSRRGGASRRCSTECRARSIMCARTAGRRRRSHREKLDRKTALVCKLERNLPWSTTSDDLRQVFQQPGPLRMPSQRATNTGRSKGWGTVLFETQEQAQAAIAGLVELEGRPTNQNRSL